MPDTAPTQTPVETPVYSPVVASKKGGYFILKVALALLASPAILNGLSHAGVTINPAGKTATVVFPVLIGTILQLIHDYAKVKTDSPAL